MNDSKDQALFRSNGETEVNVVDVCCSISKGTETAAISNDTSVLLPNQVSPQLKSSLDEEQLHFSNNGSAKNMNDNEFDHNTVKDIGVDEGVFSKNTNHFTSQGSFELESVQCKIDANTFLDLDTILDLAETRNNPTEETSDHTNEKHYLDEILASANNPFLEDSPFQTFQEDMKNAVSVSHPSNPFDFEGNNSTEPDDTSNKFSTESGVISSKNPFLDTSSFKLAMDDFKMANKTIDADIKKESAEEKTTSDSTAEAPSVITSTISSKEANEKMKAPQQCNSPPANGRQLQHESMESSFASMNPYPTLISYSGQIPFSGSMSLRSESSATSNRSFAFPVLQTELKASPVRMAKADRKHHSWKHTLLCCNF